MAMSYIQFYRKIESLTGQAPGEIMRIIRLNKAADILLNNDGNVSQTAYETGFKDPSYFAKSFKKHFGMSPTEYLKAKNTM
jgi:AraC-like DNA-binding protein